MQDAFLKKGFGIGRTFSALSPTLRIDYIFTDKHFKIKQFNRIIKELFRPLYAGSRCTIKEVVRNDYF